VVAIHALPKKVQKKNVPLAIGTHEILAVAQLLRQPRLRADQNNTMPATLDERPPLSSGGRATIACSVDHVTRPRASRERIVETGSRDWLPLV
jgi:hypothetical protein